MAHRKNPTPHDVIHQTDPQEGRDVVGVLLANAPGLRVWMNAEDYRALVEKYGERSLFLNANGQGLPYVKMKNPLTGRNASLTTLIMDTPKGNAIRFYDGDRLNFRRSNLVMVAGRTGRKNGERAIRWKSVMMIESLR